MARMSGDPHTEFSLFFARKFFRKIIGISTLGCGKNTTLIAGEQGSEIYVLFVACVASPEN